MTLLLLLLGWWWRGQGTLRRRRNTLCMSPVFTRSGFSLVFPPLLLLLLLLQRIVKGLRWLAADFTSDDAAHMAVLTEPQRRR